MLVSPKWQTMWLESQHSSKNINVHLSSQQTQKVLEDLRTSCCSPNKAVQLEALKCWEIWINNQSPDDWKVNTVCFTAVRPLISKKLQPLHKDVDICKMKLRLMWALLVKVQNIMHLEGPQYILEVFLQSCLTWLFSINKDRCENEISNLIFQLFLGIFKKSETLSDCDRESFPSLSTDILHSNKVFHHLADEFLNIFIHWRKVRDKSTILKLWKYFLEHCEFSCEPIPIPVWHKIFKLVGQICSEKSESVKERLSFLHSCATVLKSVLSSSKFIDFGNLLTTPCEALFKKLVELCTVESNECCNLEMFIHSKEICQVLSDRSVCIGGFDLCISVLDALEDFSLRPLFWGVWCGLVCCYEVHLLNTDRSKYTKVQMTFYRKLRGVAVNFELDRDTLHKDCKTEVEKHIRVLNIGCFCTLEPNIENAKAEDCSKEVEAVEVMNVDNTQVFDTPSLTYYPSNKIIPVKSNPICGKFVAVSVYNKSKLPTNTFTVSFDLVKNIFDKIGRNPAQPLFNGLFSFRSISLRIVPPSLLSLPSSNNTSIWLKTGVEKKGSRNVALPCIQEKFQPVVRSFVKKNPDAVCEDNSDEVVISAPKTRSRKRIEEEEEKRKKKESENQRKKRKSFEIIVQEIVRKNKERKTSKNSTGRRSPVILRGKRQNRVEKKLDKNQKKKDAKKLNKNINKPLEVSERKLRNSKKEEQKKKEKKSLKNDGKLENYFKVIAKKSGNAVKKEEKKPKKGKKAKEKMRESTCCSSEKEGDKKGETAWRQTSLKTMMNEKSKPEKVRHGSRTRTKTKDIKEEKAEIKRDSKRVSETSLAKLSPFKEVFHDHEYAKIQPQELQTFEKVLLSRNEKPDERKDLKKCKKSKSAVSNPKTVEIQENKESNTSESQIAEVKDLEKCSPEIEMEKPNQQNELEECPKTNLVLPCINEEEKDLYIVKEVKSSPVCNTPELYIINSDNTLEEDPEEFKEIITTSPRKAKKRLKMLDSIKQSKKIKLEEEEEKLPLEVTEKENLEKQQTELNCKKEKNGGPVKNDGSPKAMNGMISSRALRMIALVPESTKGSQVQWESPHRAELLKSKKAPNVDKNSRASKMLALLSDNVMEVEDTEFKMEEINSSRVSMTTPNVKTPISSLKSPNSVKKKRFIRFDDAKNETVLYQTDTPPSQILEEKEKCRRIKPSEVTSNEVNLS